MSTHRPLDDATAEALIAGRPTAAGDEVLVAFFEDLRASAHGPVPVASVALASVLDSGLVTEKGDLPATAASNVPGPAPQAAGLPKWRRKTMIITSLLAGLSLPLKAAAVASATALSLGGAAAAGVPVAQNAVEAVTPVNFGQDVSVDARDGGVDGKEISEKAKARAEERRQDAEAGQDAGRQDAEHRQDAGRQDAEHRQDAGRPSGAPVAPGATGLDKANETPAADYAPDSVPATPAAGADNKPADTPAGPPAETPTGAPVSTPAGPPAETPAGAPTGVPVGRP